jgi:branched-chain amino acid transport system ATP-binding protein
MTSPAQTVNGQALLAARGLAAGYNGSPVISGIDIDIHAGEVVALLGANGAGKTTTLHTLMGLVDAMQGSIHLDGRPERGSVPKRARRGMSLVTERRSVFMRLSVLDNLRLGRGDIAAAFALFPELERIKHRLAGQLSGGEQQMLTLARALSRNPRVLLADELSLGLAPMIVTRLLRAVRTAADERGLGVLLVEQHVAQAVRYADRVIVMRRGSVVLSGLPSEVGDQIESAYLSAGAQ